MMRFSVLLFTLYAVASYATWSSLAHVTPHTQEKYKIRVCLAEVPYDSLSVEVFAWFRTSRVNAWIITTREYVQPSAQGFRRYIWSDRIDESPIESIESVEYDEVLNPLRAYLSKSRLPRSYLYIDWPTTVADGGNYYSVDLSTYAGHIKSEC
ncbi:MAG: hypothetical protein AAGF72_00910 [Pseudomonadota bacterium]